MKAVVYNKKVSPFRMSVMEVEKPVPSENEVLVKVVASSLNAADYRSMQLGIIPKNKIFGGDISGIVEAVGKNIAGLKPGDEVVGETAGVGFGSFAEYVAVPGKVLVKKPAKLDFESAAAFPVSALTAWQGLKTKGKIEPGMKVLIVGSAGGVGTFAVQLAKHFGAEVTAVCSSRNVDAMKELGVFRVIDYTKDDFTKSGLQFDLVLAVNGNYPLSGFRKVMKKKSVYVMAGGSLLQVFKSLILGRLYIIGNKKMTSVAAKMNQNDLSDLLELGAAGKIKPVIEKIISLEEVPAEMNQLAKGHARGKIVVRVS